MNAQQDAQFTQYMFNTLSINPAYTGSRDALSILGLYRSQWVGLEGAPETQTFSIHSPVGKTKRLGLGLNVINDEIFITNETYVDLDVSYSIQTNYNSKLAFGIKGGIQLLDVDFTRTNPFQGGDPLASTENNIDNRLSPQVGVGLFYYSDQYYVGLSAPNLLRTEHFDQSSNSNSSSLATERVNYYLTGGYVFEINENLKLKPASLVKYVAGAPLQVDVTANALFNDKFTLGVNYRWSAAVSAIAGFQISEELLIGLAYDRETTALRSFNNGSYELFLRFEIPNSPQQLISPRFF